MMHCERCHQSVLLERYPLDEVGDLPKDAQVKLLRALQEGALVRVGGEETIQIDVRVLAATNRPLDQLVKAGTFREDLYYRLHVFPIPLPPLRQRREDLPTLVAQLVTKLASKIGCIPPIVSIMDLRHLSSHTWPGNIRELANVIETALILGKGQCLALPPFTQNTIESPSLSDDVDIIELDAVIRNAIKQALRSANGKIYGIGGAAERLGLNPGTLQSKMRKLDIRRDEFLGKK